MGPPGASSPHVLYLAYDGALSPLGQSQVVNLLLELRRQGRFRFSLISFEQPQDLARADVVASTERRLAEAGIRWTRLPYHRRPTGFATAYDVANGFARALIEAIRSGTSVVHARSYVPAAIGLAVKLFTGCSLLFDMRGFWADEKVDVGTITRESLPYRISKLVERTLLRNADVAASLSRAGVREMEKWDLGAGKRARFEVVNTFTNLDKFRPGAPRSGPFTVGYVGTAHGWYLLDPFLDVFLLILKKKPDARLLVLNRDDHEFFRSKLSARGVDPSRVEVKFVPHAEVPGELRRMHVSAFFIRPSYSKIASAPTKLGELLGSGVPCLTNSAIGDVAEILAAHDAGRVVANFTPESLQKGVEELLALAENPTTPTRCRQTAEEFFSLSSGARHYEQIYTSLL